jgi:glycogen synthase
VKVALLSRAAHPLHEPGGLERAVYHLARHLSARGVETVLFTRPPTRQGTFPGEVVFIPYGTRVLRHGRVLARTLHYPRFSLRMGEAVAAAVRAGEVDVVDAQGLTALGYGRLRRRDRTLQAPLVMNPQGMEEHKTRGIKRTALLRLRALPREAARLADRVIATDETLRGEVSCLLGVEPAKVAVLPNGIDPAEICASTPADARAFAERAVPALKHASLVLLSAGRLERYKGFADVLEAFVRARGELPPRAVWVVAGDGPERGRLSRLARTFGRQVLLLRRVEEPLLHALCERADVFVHAPRYEGSSIVTLEAMAHGLPVLATRVGGLPDKVMHGRTGCLVEPGDVEGLARALTTLGNDAAGRRAMGERGRALAFTRFAWPVIAERALALYQELLETAPA